MPRLWGSPTMVKRRFATVKSVHAQSPLIGDETAFEDRQEPKRKNECQSGPDHRMQPDRCIGPEVLGEQHQGSDDMADDEDRQIRRRIIGAVMKEFLAAIRTYVINLEVGAKHPTCTAGGTSTTQTFADGLPSISRGAEEYLIAQSVQESS
jgi:hypothetical protein